MGTAGVGKSSYTVSVLCLFSLNGRWFCLCQPSFALLHFFMY